MPRRDSVRHGLSVERKELLEYERRGEFERAAELAERLRLPAEAARLWERACEFRRAAEQQLEALRPDKAALLATRCDDEELLERCLDAVLRQPELVPSAASRLSGQGWFAIAAALHERAGDPNAAAALYARAGQPLRAARLFHVLGQPSAAERNLHRAMQLDTDAELAQLALASILERRGQLEAAARLLQQLAKRLDTSDPLLSQALARLARVLSKLELSGAAHETLRRLGQLGNRPMKPPAELAAFDATSNAEPHDVATNLLLGRYEVLERSASTATARVYRALDRVLGQTVAVKLFSPSLVSEAGRDAFLRFEREIRVLSELKHPAVVPLLDYHPEAPAVVLQWMAGGSLQSRLERASLTPAAGALVASRALWALAEAHRRGILHRDVKPDNILFDAHEQPYLADFGTAHVADHAQTITHGLLGTLAYMAPDQRQGHPANVRSDIYAVGAVLWHVLTGAPPARELPFFSEELSDSQRALARRLIDPDRLPESAAEAKALVDAEHWPTSAIGRFRASLPLQTRSVEPGQRLRVAGAAHIDSVLERPVRVVAADEPLLARARHFAAADHENLATVLRYDPKQATLWLEWLPTRTSSRLDAGQRARLREALTRLHAVGGRHGAVNPEHLGWRASEPVLLFPTSTTTNATLAEDLAKLDRLP